MPMKIGFTERGDAGLDLSWFDKIDNDQVNGAILITKNITPGFKERVLSLYQNKKKLIVHCTCTGWGGTKIEPNVPRYKNQLDALKNLIDTGFPKAQCVLRIDPIFPIKEGFTAVENVLAYADKINLLPMRIRASIFDEYPHTRQRFIDNGIAPLYEQHYAPLSMIKATAEFLTKMSEKFNLQFETCAETKLSAMLNDDIAITRGCLSKTDLDIMGIQTDINFGENIQNRYGCHCLTCKTELLTRRHPCANGCLYCYWKN